MPVDLGRHIDSVAEHRHPRGGLATQHVHRAEELVTNGVAGFS